MQALENHYRTFFEGHACDVFQWNIGPMASLAPTFRVMRFAPGPRSELWVYVSLGAHLLRTDGGKFEFAIFSQDESPRFVELLTMSAYYHRSQGLDQGHTVPLGEPWVEGSSCDHYLVSLPYPLGPDFEICCVDDQHIHTLWLLPITQAERDLKVKQGQETLEALFEDRGLEFWNLRRVSIV